MRILGRKFYAYKSKNRRKITPDSAFPRTLSYMTMFVQNEPGPATRGYIKILNVFLQSLSIGLLPVTVSRF